MESTGTFAPVEKMVGKDGRTRRRSQHGSSHLAFILASEVVRVNTLNMTPKQYRAAEMGGRNGCAVNSAASKTVGKAGLPKSNA
jgi:hypothetical protein